MHKKFVWPIRVYFGDTDAGGVVYHANYLEFLERARSEWLRVLNFDQRKFMQETGVGFAVRSVAIEYLKPARLDDELRVISTLKSLGRAQMLFTQSIERGEDVLITATVRVACMDLVRGKATALPTDIHEKFAKLI
ncbi:MAG: tol-pal system-associated acyl-CoA thioesterase [Zoogloeaceae bacterium]|jgi:acyl-CoA thioester hydrolase|nr:tol-pal system-associated acyl-CoA thioesterase [Zoogloeaceae bacterium]